jgi:acetyl-CoA carboxylase/biotin carboxylase 1
LGVPKRTAQASQALEERVAAWGGDRPFHSVLVANNGLAAVKFIRSVRTWAYKTLGDERAVNLIAMATPEDMRADAEHIRMADQFVEVPGGRNVNNYANVQLIASVAVRTGVDAVWPGW